MNATFLKSCSQISEIPPGNKPHVAFVGRSNVGKSSLINSLTGQKLLSKVSSTPGRTQLLNLFDIDGKFFLTDLPGYGFAKVSKKAREQFQNLIFDYLWKCKELQLVVVIVEARAGITPLDTEMLDFLTVSKIPFMIVASKADKLSRSELIAARDGIIARYPHTTVIPHSTVTNAGKSELWQVIKQAVAK